MHLVNGAINAPKELLVIEIWSDYLEWLEVDCGVQEQLTYALDILESSKQRFFSI